MKIPCIRICGDASIPIIAEGVLSGWLVLLLGLYLVAAAKGEPDLTAPGLHALHFGPGAGPANRLSSEDKEATLMPKRVSLDFINQPLRDVFAEISRQTGYKIEFQPGDDKKLLYAFHFDKVTFWEAVDRVCESGNLACQQSEDDGVLSIQPSDNRVPFVHRNGPIRAVAQGFKYRRAIDFTRLVLNPGDLDHRDQSLAFTFILATEQGLPFLITGTPRVTAAYDEQNHSMVPVVRELERDGRRRPATGSKSFTSLVKIDLDRPAPDSRKVKLLRGEIPVTFLADIRITVDGILSARGKKFSNRNVSCGVSAVEETVGNGTRGCRITLWIEAKDRKTANVNWFKSMELHDARGNKYAMGNYRVVSEKSDGTSERVEGTLDFRDPGNGPIGMPAQLIVHAWTAVDHEVAFEFQDLPLP